MMTRAFLAAVLFAGMAVAHPMGNLSINHYARIEPGGKGVSVTYVLDLAEIPTFELTQTWDTAAGAPKAVLDRKAAGQAREWVRNLTFRLDGRAIAPVIGATTLTIIDGAGNLPVFRVATKLRLPPAAGQTGRLEYEDRNFATRAGWREIVVRPADGAQIRATSAPGEDISQGLTSYPQDPTKAPPQDTKAWVEWTAVAPVLISGTAPVAAVPVPVARDVRPAETQALGTVKRNDSISRILRMAPIPWRLMLLLILLAFWFGALHALEPGHGKTMVAAYLVGEKGTVRHAVLLGGTVTFTHTVSVFLLGLGTMFLSRYIMPDKISGVLGIVSGLSMVWIGGVMLWKRVKRLAAAPEEHGHEHSHAHPHPHPHTHDHSHVPEGGVGIGSLIALGASGGLVPCPSALILLLSAISIGRPGLGVLLLVSFSLGLALVLTLTGLLVLYARNLLPEGRRTSNGFFRWMPIVSAAAILIIGALMTGVSLGWVPIKLSLG